jgi:predicted dehydrogenase
VSLRSRGRTIERGHGLKLAVVGCGAITEIIHLPVVSRSRDLEVVGLVDASGERARELARAYGIDWTASDHREVIGRAEAVVLAVPHHLHAPMAVDLLDAGVHVLVEKPMALSVAECDQMIDSATRSGSVLAVGLQRRFFGANKLVAAAVHERRFGPARHFEFSEGGLYRWPMRSSFALDPAQAGGGVLADLGIHALDLVSWWFGSVERVGYRDDARGGVEAEAHAELEFESGVRGRVMVTKLREVPDSIRVDFEHGTLLLEDAGSEPSPRVRLRASGGEWEPVESIDASRRAPTRRKVFARQLADFHHAIQERVDPVVSGREGRKSVELLERCYRERLPLIHPWESEN